MILDLNQLDYNACRVLFETHFKAYGVFNHLDDTSNLKEAIDAEWGNIESLVAMWIYGSLTHRLLIMVLKNGYKDRDIWKALEDLFCDNKDARAIKLENELRSMVIGDLSVM